MFLLKSNFLFRFLQNFSKVQITEERVRKVVKSRIFSVAVHPTVDKILVGAGGKWGAVGLWDVVSIFWEYLPFFFLFLIWNKYKEIKFEKS